MVKVEVKSVPGVDDFTFEYADHIDSPVKALYLMEAQLDLEVLVTMKDVTITFPSGDFFKVLDYNKRYIKNGVDADASLVKFNELMEN